LKKFLIFILFSIIILDTGYAQVGSFAGAFSRLGFSARGMGMSNAMVADVYGDINGIYNPALATFQEEGLVNLGYSFLSLDRKLNFLGFTKKVKLPNQETGGAGLKYIENIMIIGNERMFITALIVPVVAELEKFAKENNIQYNSLNELISDSKLIRLIQKDIDELQKDLAHHERIRKLTLIDKPFTIEGGELTPTMKIKRKYVAEMYKNEIESMYPRM